MDLLRDGLKILHHWVESHRFFYIPFFAERDYMKVFFLGFKEDLIYFFE